MRDAKCSKVRASPAHETMERRGNVIRRIFGNQLVATDSSLAQEIHFQSQKGGGRAKKMWEAELEVSLAGLRGCPRGWRQPGEPWPTPPQSSIGRCQYTMS